MIPLIRREHVAGFYSRRPVWLVQNLGLDRIRQRSRADGGRRGAISTPAPRKRARDPSTRKLLGDLAAAERKHEAKAEALEAGHSAPARAQRRRRKGAPAIRADLGAAGPRRTDGRIGLDTGADFRHRVRDAQHLDHLHRRPRGRRSAPASRWASPKPRTTTACISGRGSPLKRGLASGVMTDVGGLGHALPYLIPHFWTATAIAGIVVFIELWVIAWIQNRYGDAVLARGIPGGGRRLAGSGGRHPDRRKLTRQAASIRLIHQSI